MTNEKLTKLELKKLIAKFEAPFDFTHNITVKVVTSLVVSCNFITHYRTVSGLIPICFAILLIVPDINYPSSTIHKFKYYR